MTREFVILPQFERLWKNLRFGEDDMRPLEEFLCLHPDHGNGGSRYRRIEKAKMGAG